LAATLKRRNYQGSASSLLGWEGIPVYFLLHARDAVFLMKWLDFCPGKLLQGLKLIGLGPRLRMNDHMIFNIFPSGGL
jgi:hypothetical protein|tara:strand:- start:2984 stop:3217 length:234 start_codon:yes stop_codon:yes gene_type:complete